MERRGRRPIWYFLEALSLLWCLSISRMDNSGVCHYRYLLLRIANIVSKSDYQTAKQQYLKTAKTQGGFDQESLNRGFVTTGLWSLSRHPNFAAEQTIWVVLYMWGCWTSEVVFNWTFAGAMSYLILFQASTWFTELITAKKYPDYQEYQARVGKFLPNIFSRGPIFANAEKKVATAIKSDKRKVSASK